MNKKAYHGGAFFDAVGNNFSTLEKHESIINADVLDAWFPPSPRAIEKIKSFLPYILQTSPPTHAEGFIDILAEKRGIPKEHIIVAGGSSDIMMILFPRFIKTRDTVLILDPMYGEYQHIFENVLDVNLIRHTLRKENEFVLDIDAFISDINNHHPHVVVIVNPNNPTGKYFDEKEVIRILDSIPSETLFVVDESYIDYVDSGLSLEKLVASYPNLMIIKSMSKVYALSGARVGYLVADPRHIEQLAPFVPPWSVSLVAQVAAVEALKDQEYYQMRHYETHVLRKEFMEELGILPHVKLYDSCANFFLVELDKEHVKKGVAEIVQRLREDNIFIRNCDSMSPQFNDDFLRIAVKDRVSNKKIVTALARILAE